VWSCICGIGRRLPSYPPEGPLRRALHNGCVMISEKVWIPCCPPETLSGGVAHSCYFDSVAYDAGVSVTLKTRSSKSGSPALPVLPPSSMLMTQPVAELPDILAAGGPTGGSVAGSSTTPWMKMIRSCVPAWNTAGVPISSAAIVYTPGWGPLHALKKTNCPCG